MSINMKRITTGAVDVVAREIIRVPTYKAFGIIEWISLLQALSTCYSLRKNSKALYQLPFLSALFAFFVYCFGGSTLLSIFICSPAPWLASSRFVAVFCGMFCLSFLCPFKFVFCAMEKLQFLFDPLFAVIDAFGGSISLTMHGIESVRKTPSLPDARNNFFALVTCGFIYSYGGALLCQMFNLKEISWKFQAPTDFTHPSRSFKQAIVLPFIYVYLLNIRKIPTQTAAAVIVLLNLSLKLYFYVFGSYLNSFELKNIINHESIACFIKTPSKATTSKSSTESTPSTPRRPKAKSEFYSVETKTHSSSPIAKASPRSKVSGMSLRDRSGARVSEHDI